MSSSPISSINNSFNSGGTYLNTCRVVLVNSEIQKKNKNTPESPNDAFIYISMGNILQTIGDYENAYKAFNQAQVIYPEFKYNYLNMANIEYFRKNYKNAIEYYNAFLSSYPDHLEASENLANVYYLANQSDKSCEIYSALYKILSGSIEIAFS